MIDQISGIGMLAAADRAKLDRLLWLTQQDAHDLAGDDLAEAREAAGLSRGQAARTLEIPRDDLLRLELGFTHHLAEPPERRLLCRMNDVYGLAQNREQDHE